MDSADVYPVPGKNEIASWRGFGQHMAYGNAVFPFP